MKTLLVVLLVLCAVSAFGQTAGSISSQVQVLRLPEHPEHATVHSMAVEQPIVGGTGPETYAYAQGERPLWEFGAVAQGPSLGDVARAYRKEKLTGKKAEITLEEQGTSTKR